MTDQINARDWIFQVESATPNTWLDILGRKKFTVNRGEHEEVEDTTTFESLGNHESQPMQRGGVLELEGVVLLTTGNVRDPGQARLDVLAAAVGEPALSRLRFRHTVQTLWTIWPGWIAPKEEGGETNKKTSWGIAWTRSGAASTAAV